MFNFIRILFIWLLLTGAVAAQDKKLENLPDKEEIWSAIDARDFAAAEAAFANAHLRQQQGEIDPDGIRWLFEIFGTNSPAVTEFTAEWLEIYPDSPYANIAQAWVNHRTGWYIRGKKYARETYRGALAEFRTLHEEAWHYAQKAYELDNSLRPASDALLRLGNSTGRRTSALEVLEEVMSKDPNIGTLTRAVDMTMPGWGGTWELAEKICDRYGPMIEWNQGDPLTYCKLYAVGNYYMSEDRSDWLKETLMSGNFPDLERLLLPWFTSRDANRIQAEFARRYLSRDDVIEVKYARAFDKHIALRYDFDFLSGVHTQRAWDHAREAIKRDPYNVDLIETLQSGVHEVTRTETGSKRTLVEGLTPKDELEYARRKLVASPYTPRNWRHYGHVLFLRSSENLLEREPYDINAIYFDDHSPRSLLTYAFEKWRLLAKLEGLEMNLQSENFKSLSAKQQELARAEYAKLITARELMDLDRDIRCPMMRAYRLFQFICETSRSQVCRIPDPEAIEMLDIVQYEVNQRRICTGVMAAPFRDLFFEYQDIDLSAPEG